MRRLVTGACVVLTSAGWMVWHAWSSTGVAAGWSMEVVPGEYRRVDNLAFDDNGELYATLELADTGRVVRIDGARGETIVSGLQRPCGLIHSNGRLYFTEEVFDGRVDSYELENKQRKTVSRFRNPEGLAVDGRGTLYVSEDTSDGQLLAIDGRGTIRTLVRHLKRPEGLAVGSDGEIFVAETASGRILKYHNGVVSEVIDQLREPDQVRVAADGALWITEDKRNGRLFRYASGNLQIIADGLRAPQGIAFDGLGRIYVAEQKRDRILVFSSRE